MTPFVTRSHYVAMRTEYIQALAEAQARCDAERADRLAAQDAADRKYADLLARYHALKLNGHSEAPAPVVPTPKAADPVMQAITAIAGRSSTLRSQMVAQARRDRAAGMDDADIIAKIQRGQPVSDDERVTP